ncbi:hypothetical protein HYN69_16815 [Gemmobacter aquarius]|uniref:HutD protein n=1 Tax=Paragemmobacter aquarius TaxID=2169400 RepID=A0A2S0UQ87_9RHOB|nr:HutD family protein [Gemmobacter aquarius]AWB49942.1 hypothetical protein HYN69_16815 [Gemmobacter aquarius]
MRILGCSDYREMPWANGKGVTVELAKAMRHGRLLWRLSMAVVAEDGPFSIFPDIERNLTVLDGAGFRLLGEAIDLDCQPLRPVAFAGDIPVSAVIYGGVSTDFNVMTDRALPLPEVAVSSGQLAAGGLLAMFALDKAVVNDAAVEPYGLALVEGAAQVIGRVLAVRLFV